jgi:hypothetical protein
MAGGVHRIANGGHIEEPANNAGPSPGSNFDRCNARVPAAAHIPATQTDAQTDHELHTTKPLTVTVATARKISGLGNTTLWALIKDRRLQAVRIGRRTLITYCSLEALLAPDSGAEPKPRPRDRMPRARKTSDRAPGDT